MDETTYRILDTLWKETGRPVSIRELTSKIKYSHGTAYYPNIYEKMRSLTSEGMITLTKAGRSSLANLNFENYLLIDLLTELDLRKKHDLLIKSKGLQMLFKDIEERCVDIRSIESISAIRAERNLKLNRTELLFLLYNSKGNGLHLEETSIHTIGMDMQALHNVRIDPLIMTAKEFLESLTSDEINPLREMLYNETTFHSPQGFWSHVAATLAEGYGIKLLQSETNPAKIADKDMVFNLARFGYKEIGPELREGQRICIEYIIASIMMREEARRMEAVPIILAKSKANYSLLIFLSQKYGMSGRLVGLLRALNEIKPSKETTAAIETLEILKPKEIRPDYESIEEKMRLYGAIR